METLSFVNTSPPGSALSPVPISPVPTTPILPGCHPDPSICRAGDDYYLITSTFTLLPGLPIYHSTDLQVWNLAGHALPREGLIDLEDLDASDGVWAPTIRFHRGTFYVVFTVAESRQGRDTFLCTADDPAGPWSAPQRLEAQGIDPSLFFDDDGRCWFTAARDATAATATGPGEVWMRELDLSSRELVGDELILWHGALAGAWVEAPHIYHHAGRYHLVCAEGGTERNHAVTAASADEVTGPYRTDLRSPLLTHRHLSPAHPVQNVGHADLVQTDDGWVACLLGVRPFDGFDVLGRETFLVGVEWTDFGPAFAPSHTPSTPSARDVEQLDWMGFRNPPRMHRAGNGIRLAARPDPVLSRNEPSFVGFRQPALDTAFSAVLTAPLDRETFTGLVAMQPQSGAVSIGLTRTADGPSLVARLSGPDGETVLACAPAPQTCAVGIRSSAAGYELCRLDGADIEVIAEVPAKALSSETSRGFFGALLGLTHQGPDHQGPAAIDDIRLGEWFSPVSGAPSCASRSSEVR